MSKLSLALALYNLIFFFFIFFFLSVVAFLSFSYLYFCLSFNKQEIFPLFYVKKKKLNPEPLTFFFLGGGGRWKELKAIIKKPISTEQFKYSSNPHLVNQSPYITL